MSDCLFCAIVAGEIPANRVHEDDQVVAFRDINPQAPTHILVIPREHLDSAADGGGVDGVVVAVHADVVIPWQPLGPGPPGHRRDRR